MHVLQMERRHSFMVVQAGVGKNLPEQIQLD